jgi:hypothetical protein
MAMSNRARCFFCGDTVDTREHSTFQYVHGWVAPRSQGGANALRLRDPQPRWACSTCIDLRVKRLENQGQLF